MIGSALALAAVATSVRQDATAQAPEDVVVTARRTTGAPIADAVDQWRSLCFDAMRQTRGFARPRDDSDWQALDAHDRKRFGVIDDNVPAYGLIHPTRGHTLLIKFERFEKPTRLTEDRCTMVIVGGRDPARLIAEIDRVMGAPGTERHVGETDGSSKVAGWSQRIWTATPPNGSKAWRGVAVQGSARAARTWVVVTDPVRFYREKDYVLVDLKVRQGTGQPLSVLTLSVTRASSRQMTATGR